MIRNVLSPIGRILRKRIWRVPLYVPLALLLIAGAYLGYRQVTAPDAPLQTVTATRGTVREEVSVVGRIQPTERLDLALQGSGRIAYVGTSEGARVRRGQLLVSLSGANLQAQLQAALAGLDQQRLRLDQLREGARTEDVAVTRTSRDNAELALAAQLRQSFSSVDSTLGASVDQLYADPRSGSPRFGASIAAGASNYFINAPYQDRIRLQEEQAETVRRMDAWRAALDGGDRAAALAAAQRALPYAQSYLADLAAVINAYRADNTTQQAIYAGFKADVAAARSAVSGADAAVTAAAASLASAESQLALKTAPAGSTDVLIQEAAVRAAQAQVAAVRAQLAENAVVSPVDGVVTKLDAQVGESASPSRTLVSVMADARYEIEARVPEADIAKIKVGDEARATMDAYPGERFAARVIFVAPAEDLVEGVATYKVKLQLTADDARVKPGMTIDMDISTNTREDVVVVPQRVVVTRGDRKVVRIPDGERTREVEVRTGIRGTDGMIEIVSGLREGEVVVSGSAD